MFRPAVLLPTWDGRAIAALQEEDDRGEWRSIIHGFSINAVAPFSKITLAGKWLRT